MPWTAADATNHTSHAHSAKAKRLWADVASKVLHETGDEGRAVREANAAVNRLNRARKAKD
jgi:hypothetical protein